MKRSDAITEISHNTTSTFRTYFQQECPACGRTLQIMVVYLGKTVSCRHCRRMFIAQDSTMQVAWTGQPTLTALEKAERLLRQLESMAPATCDGP